MNSTCPSFRLRPRGPCSAGLLGLVLISASMTPSAVEARDILRIPERVVNRARATVGRIAGEISGDRRSSKPPSSKAKTPPPPVQAPLPEETTVITNDPLSSTYTTPTVIVTPTTPAPPVPPMPSELPLSERSTTAVKPRVTPTEAAPAPANPPTRLEPLAQPPSLEDTPALTDAKPAPTPTVKSKPDVAAKAPAPDGPAVARRVPGKEGMVYPPGVEESTATMIDVRGMASGQLAKDPRTGKIFRVP
jgi:hypothetical protein